MRLKSYLVFLILSGLLLTGCSSSQTTKLNSSTAVNQSSNTPAASQSPNTPTANQNTNQSTSVKSDATTVSKNGMFLGNTSLNGHFESGPKVLNEVKWKTEGQGGEPVVGDGMLFHVVDGSLVAANTTDGTEKWSFKPSEGEASTAPLVYNNIVYIGCRDEYIYALDSKTGKVMWKGNAQGGITSNLIPVDNFIFVGTDKGKLMKIDTDNHKVSSISECQNSIVSRIFYSNGDLVVYYTNIPISFGKMGVVIANIDYNKSAIKWQITDAANISVGTGIPLYPIIDDDKIYYYKYPQAGVQGCQLIAANIDTGKIISNSRINPDRNPLISGGVAYSSDDYSQELSAVDVQTGQIRWKFSYRESSDGFTGPILANGALYLGKGHHVFIVDSKTGQEISSIRLEDTVIGTPYPDNDVIYVPCFHYTYAIQ